MTPLITGSAAGRPMSWEEYWALPEELRAEYVDGLVYVNPPASFSHQKICLRLYNVLTATFGDRCVVAAAVGWQLPTQRRILRIPDLMLLAAEPDADVVTGPIPVAVEVLSNNRRVDLVAKATEYLEAGAGQYWIVDPRDRVITVLERAAVGWAQVTRLTDDEPTATFHVAPFGPIVLALTDVLG